MLSLIVLFLLFILSLCLIKFFRHPAFKFFALIVLLAFMVEAMVFGYFLIKVYQGQCLTLIGYDKTLDQLIKLRVVYSTYYAQNRKEIYDQFDNELGYTIGRNKLVPGEIVTNNQGMRADKDYPILPSKEKLRIAAMGDSYVWCMGEKNEATWPYQLEHMAGNLEVMNFGVGGYGFGQSYLRYFKDAIRYSPDVLFINYAVLGLKEYRDDIETTRLLSITNDLRVANFYRVRFFLKDGVLTSRALTPFDLFDKNFREEFLFDSKHIIRNSKLGFLNSLTFCNFGVLLNQLVMPAAISQYKYERYLEKNYEKLTLKMLENLMGIAERNNTQVLFFGNHMESSFEDLPQSVQDLLSKSPNFMGFVDLKEAIEEGAKRHNAVGVNLKNDKAHFNALGNQIYAEAVLNALKSRFIGMGERVFRFDEKKNAFINVKTEAK